MTGSSEPSCLSLVKVHISFGESKENRKKERIEEYSEAGLCWENIMRRIDAENRLVEGD